MEQWRRVDLSERVAAVAQGGRLFLDAAVFDAPAGRYFARLADEPTELADGRVGWPVLELLEVAAAPLRVTCRGCGRGVYLETSAAVVEGKDHQVLDARNREPLYCPWRSVSGHPIGAGTTLHVRVPHDQAQAPEEAPLPPEWAEAGGFLRREVTRQHGRPRDTLAVVVAPSGEGFSGHAGSWRLRSEEVAHRGSTHGWWPTRSAAVAAMSRWADGL